MTLLPLEEETVNTKPLQTLNEKLTPNERF